MSKNDPLHTKIFDQNSGNTVIIPVDDSALSGPEDGLRDMKSLLSQISDGGVNAIIGFRGTFTKYPTLVKEKGKIFNLTFSSTRSNHTKKVQITTVEDARRLGADAVAVHVNICSRYAGEMFEILGRVRSDCDKVDGGIPLLAFMYPRGETSDGTDENFYQLYESHPEEYTKLVKHAVRIGAELGADIIKTPYAPNFNTVVESALDVPIIMAGGPKISTTKILHRVREVIDMGARGVAIGRNGFNHENPQKMVLALGLVVHHKKSPEEAMKIVQISSD